MTTPNTQPTEENIRIQGVINQIGGRLETDPAFKAQYVADPNATLLGAGLPQEVLGQVTGLIAKASGDNEVTGYDDYNYEYKYEYTPATATSSSTSGY